MRKILAETKEKIIHYVVAESLATFLPARAWKVENVPQELGGLTEESSRQA